MIQITKRQATYLRAAYPDLQITRTCKKKSKAKRGKRYVEESGRVKQALARFVRDEGVV